MFSILVICLHSGCLREELESKPDKALILPSTVADFQALLDNNNVMNSVNPWLGQVGSDDYYVLPARYNSVGQMERNAYIWKPDVYRDVPESVGAVLDWFRSYVQVYYANVALEGLAKLSESESGIEYNTAKGSALFFRAHAYWWLAQEFCKPYSLTTAASDLGLPLRIDPDPLALVGRSSLEETYDLIINDLIEAESLLTNDRPATTRPSKAAAQGMLARVFLSMGDYDAALTYADKYLSTNSTLLDYNEYDALSPRPFPDFNSNKEVAFHAFISGSALVVNPTNCHIAPDLYDLFESNDLRKGLYFSRVSSTGLLVYKGGYYGTIGYIPWTGIATDEIYLVRAECLARAGQIESALQTLNDLLATRWRKDTFIPFEASSAEEALTIILEERRKELLFRGLRWTDLRRLNLEGAEITISRELDGVTYTLPPNDPRYVYPIPPYELSYNPMQQNER